MSALHLRGLTPEDLAAIHARAAAAGYRSTAEWARRVLLGLEAGPASIGDVAFARGLLSGTPFATAEDAVRDVEPPRDEP